MRKIETIWHHILLSALENSTFKFTQKELAERFSFSLSTVNHSLNAPSQIGAIRKESKFFVLQDFKKLLYYWASVRNLARDIHYETHHDGTVQEIEGLMPPECIYACYSSVRMQFDEVPADYDHVYCYVPPARINMCEKRFPKSPDSPNISFLKAGEHMHGGDQTTSLPQTFVDIWNLKDWFAGDFIKLLEEKIQHVLQ